MKNHPDKVKRILSNSPHLRRLLQNGSEQHKALDTIKNLLDKQVASHCISAAFGEGRVKIFTDSAAWASRLRFQSQSLLQQLKTQGHPVQQLDVRVYLDNLKKPAPRKKPANKPVLSRSAANLLLETAEGLSDDEQLSAALKRLAARAV
jgi:hypothetical protein